MAGKDASARIETPTPLTSSAEITPDFDALERAAESIRPAWDGIEAPVAPVEAVLVEPAPVLGAASAGTSADSTHRMQALRERTPREGLDDFLTSRTRGRSRLPLVLGGVALGCVLLVLLLRFSGEATEGALPPGAPSTELAAPPSRPEPPATAREELAAPVNAPATAKPATTDTASNAASAAEPSAKSVDTASQRPARETAPAAARARRKEQRAARPAPKASTVKRADAVRRAPVPAAKQTEPPKPRKGVGFVSDNPY